VLSGGTKPPQLAPVIFLLHSLHRRQSPCQIWPSTTHSRPHPLAVRTGRVGGPSRMGVVLCSFSAG
jgi:hypothetical protein